MGGEICSDLTTHMSTRSGDRPYLCTACGREFSTSSGLTTHIRTHTGDRPYPMHHLRSGLLAVLQPEDTHAHPFRRPLLIRRSWSRNATTASPPSVARPGGLQTSFCSRSSVFTAKNRRTIVVDDDFPSTPLGNPKAPHRLRHPTSSCSRGFSRIRARTAPRVVPR